MRRFLATLTLFVATLSITSCKLEKPDFGDQLYVTDLAGKWEGTSVDYKSIEFVDLKYYFVTKTEDNSVEYGTFRKTDDKQFTLNGFGVIDVSTCNAQYLTFGLTLEGSENSLSQTALAVEVDDTYTSDNSHLISTLWAVSGNSDIKYLLFTTAQTFMVIDQQGTATTGRWWWMIDSSTAGEIGCHIVSDLTQYEKIEISYLSATRATITYKGAEYNLTPYSGSF